MPCALHSCWIRPNGRLRTASIVVQWRTGMLRKLAQQTYVDSPKDWQWKIRSFPLCKATLKK